MKLQRILDRIQQANPEKLAGIFGDVAWGNKERLPEPALQSLIDTFDRLTLNPQAVPHDMLGAAYEYLLKQFADESGRKAGEFFTPRAVVLLLVKILDPKPEETIYDPACGSGGMLVETIGEVRERGGDSRTLRLYGQEVNLTTFSIARMNLYLHNIEDFQILRGDTLRDPRFRESDGAGAPTPGSPTHARCSGYRPPAAATSPGCSTWSPPCAPAAAGSGWSCPTGSYSVAAPRSRSARVSLSPTCSTR